jgi:hypothetical protein
MLVLTCRIGDTVRIGDDLCMTVQSRFRSRVTVEVIAPAGQDLYFDNACLRPSVLPSGAWSYMFSMLAVRSYRVGEVEVRVWMPGDAVSLAADCDEYLHIGVIAPQSLRVSCEQETPDIQPIDEQSRAVPALCMGMRP